MIDKSELKKSNRTVFKNKSMDDGFSCIDTYRIFDSCKIKECARNLRLFLSPDGSETVQNSTNIRVKSTKVIWNDITTDKVYFTNGLYQINIRYYFLITLECCVPTTGIEEVLGFCFFDKSVHLFGGTGSVSVFKAYINSGFCGRDNERVESVNKSPVAVVETTNPIPLKISVNQINESDEPAISNALPQSVLDYFPNGFANDQNRRGVYISLGIFSIVRMERLAELIIPACDYCVPKDEASFEMPENDSYSLFNSMEFPINEFCSGLGENQCEECSVNENVAEISFAKDKDEEK